MYLGLLKSIIHFIFPAPLSRRRSAHPTASPVGGRRGGPASQGPELPIGTGVSLKAPKTLTVSDPRTPAPRPARTSLDSVRGLSPFTCSTGARAARRDGVQSGSASPPAPRTGVRAFGWSMWGRLPAGSLLVGADEPHRPHLAHELAGDVKCIIISDTREPAPGRLEPCFLVSFGTPGAGHIIYWPTSKWACLPTGRACSPMPPTRFRWRTSPSTRW